MSQSILIIDDEPHILQVLYVKLANAGFTVLTAQDGEIGLEIARRETPDLIITDFHMPHLSGIGLCRALAEDVEMAGIPVIMLTARGYALSADDLATGNIVEVMSKPFSPRGLLRTVETLIGPATSARREAA